MELSVDISKELKDFELKINVDIGKETLGFLGASGSGKSMTLRCIAGLVKPDKGRIILNGRVLFDSERRIDLPVQKRNVGLLFQNYALFANLTVKENISFGLRNLPSKEQEHKVREKMEMMGLMALQDRYPRQISGGEQQRTALARTLVTEPDCLLLDEPFSALDNHIRSQLEKELLDTLVDFKGAVVFVTHNLKECYRVSKKIMIIDRGEIVSYGTRDQVFIDPQTVKAARLTGCSNISRLQPVLPGKVRALDWGCDLKIKNNNMEGATHLGIREHQIKLVEEPDLPNTYPCWVDQVTETPFNVTLNLKLGGQAKEANDSLLQAVIPKEEYEGMKKKPFPWLAQLKAEHIFYLKDSV
jgi:molybdate transport system permease protein